jgi:hypothetical protein
MLKAFKFSNRFEIDYCEERFTARSAKILEPLPVMALAAGGAFKMS